MASKFRFDRSMELFSRALKLMPAGASSNARLWQTAQFCPVFTPCTIFARRASGSHIWDVDGNEYIDYRLGFGPIILGHSYPAVTKEIHRGEKKGTVYALDNELELSVAERLIKMVPCAERVRFSVTGTEATMHAIRVARAYTKKDVVLKFEGHYHGAHDYVLFSTHPPYTVLEKKAYPMSPGIPRAISKLVLVERWNDFDALEKTVKENHKKIAAIITEPVMGNAAAITPEKGYLRFMRELCDRYGIVLIFDEVKTGFRLARGGAQELYRVKPHLATFAKSMSNGYPMSAITGEEEIMGMFGPKNVVHGGTYASNPVSLTAAEATLKILDRGKVFRYLDGYGTKMMKGLGKIFAGTRHNFIVQGLPQMFQFVCTPRTGISNYKQLRETCDFVSYSKIQYELLKLGVMVDEDNQEPMYTCFSHSKEDLKRTLSAFGKAVDNASRAGEMKSRIG